MARLKDRNRHIPGGFRIKIPELKYQSPPFASFDTIVREVYRLVNANPKVADDHHLPRELHLIENWVDRYNADICERNGWNTYILSDGGADVPPKWIPAAILSRLGAGRVAAGAKALLSWLGDGADPVPPAQSEARSAICAACPHNRKVEFNDFFFRTASEMIRRQVEFAKDVGLNTTNDEKLGVCEICACPLKLMQHVGLKYKLESLDEETFKKLPSHCWVVQESAAIEATSVSTSSPATDF